MPSQTIYVKDDLYSYADETSDDSVGKRLAELARKGMEVSEE